METFKKKFQTKTKMEREVYFLNKLSSYKYFPKVVSVNKDTNELEMSFCGNVLEEGSEPRLWRRQTKEIISILEKESIYHNDIHDENFLCKNNKIFLVDFGRATENKEAFPFLNVSSSCLDDCDSFFHVFLHAEKNFKKIHRA